MEKPEITEGIRSAIERGYSLNSAVSSFINAGYNRQDVLDSAKVFGGSFLQLNNIQSSIPNPEITPRFPVQNQMQTTHPKVPIPQFSPDYQGVIQVKPKKGWGIVVFLIIVLLLLLGSLFTLILAKEQVIWLLGKIGISL